MRIACCGHIPFAEVGHTADIADVALDCAREAGFEDVEVASYDVPLDLVDASCSPKVEEPIDLVVCGVGMRGVSGAQLIRDVKHVGSPARIVLCAEDPGQALEAFDLGVEAVIAVPTSWADLRFSLVRVLRDMRACYERSMTLRVREGVRRICPSRLLYAETADHDQVIHLAGGSTLSVRVSSQGLFDMLEGAGQFFKAGSSYIVNVRKVKVVDASASTATMADGTVIPIPGRVRKALEDAVMASSLGEQVTGEDE